jgi:hypothetical protein
MLRLACPKMPWTILELTFFLASNVAQVVEADIRKSSPLEEELEAPVYEVRRIEGRADGAGKDEVRISPVALRRRYVFSLALSMGLEGLDSGDPSRMTRPFLFLVVLGRDNDHARAVPRSQ